MNSINRFVVRFFFLIGGVFTQATVLGSGVPGRTVDPQGGTVDITNNAVGGAGNPGSPGQNVTGPGAPGGAGGPGDAGGAGVSWQSGGTVNNKAVIRGGPGGQGGTGGKGGPSAGPGIDNPGVGGTGGTGGTGGVGITVGSGQTFNNTSSGVVEGGNGGAGGNGGPGGNGGGQPGATGSYGVSGNAINMTGSGIVTNTGVIIGGGGATPVPGIRVEGSDNKIINAGTISGGSVNVNAIEITGNNNTLELHAGYVFNGKVAASGNNHQLALGGNTNATFDLSSVGGSLFAFSGFSTFAKKDNSTWTLTGHVADPLVSSATWLVQAGTLRAGLGTTNIFGSNSAFTVANSGILDLNGLNQTLGSLSNAGTVKVGVGGAPGVLLKIHGPYTSNGGTLVLNTQLAGSDSPTDKLEAAQVVMGSGPTTLQINNTGGLGAQTTDKGIEVVKVLDATNSAPEAFELKEKVVEVGAYGYALQQTDGNWYLTSTLPSGGARYSTGLAVNLVSPALAHHINQAMIGGYQHRLSKDENSVWMRVLHEKSKVGQKGIPPSVQAQRFLKYGPNYDMRLSGVQFGVDAYESEDGSVGEVAGVYLGAARIKGDVQAVDEGKAGTSALDGYAVGGYWSQKDNEGYVDWVIQAMHYGKVRNESVSGNGVNTRGVGFAVSVEEGKTLPFARGWSLEPQLQLVYHHIRLKKGSDSTGDMQYDQLNVVNARVGTRLNKSWGDSEKPSARAWLGANMWRQFTPEAKSTIVNPQGSNPEIYKTDLGRTWGQVGLGLTGQLTKNIGLTAVADYTHSLGGNKKQGVGGKLQLDVNW